MKLLEPLEGIFGATLGYFWGNPGSSEVTKLILKNAEAFVFATDGDGKNTNFGSCKCNFWVKPGGILAVL
jgi:hypothetical protein